MKSLAKFALFGLLTLGFSSQASGANCPVSIQNYFRIGSGTAKGLVQYQVTLVSQTHAVTTVYMVAKSSALTRAANFNADFGPNPYGNGAPSNFEVVVFFPWEKGEAPSISLQGYGDRCAKPVALENNGISPAPEAFDDSAIALGPDLEVSIVAPVGFVRKIMPYYPDSAKSAGVQGTAEVAVMIGQGGRVLSTWIYQTSHSDALDGAALAAARGSTFREPESAGKPVAATYIISYSFVL